MTQTFIPGKDAALEDSIARFQTKLADLGFNIEEGEFAWEKMKAQNMTEFEFFMELRLHGVEHLGQVRLAILETNGQISVYYYPDDLVRPGLSILPEYCSERFERVPEDGDYACIRCSEVLTINAGIKTLCPRCKHHQWVKASAATRVT